MGVFDGLRNSFNELKHLGSDIVKMFQGHSDAPVVADLEKGFEKGMPSGIQNGGRSAVRRYQEFVAGQDQSAIEGRITHLSDLPQDLQVKTYESILQKHPALMEAAKRLEAAEVHSHGTKNPTQVSSGIPGHGKTHR